MDRGNDYLVQVKGNQEKLLNACKQICIAGSYTDIYESSESSRGRYEIRRVKIYKATEAIPEGWQGLNRIISVERLTTRKGKEDYRRSYYISSIESDDAELFGEGIRGHWSIENGLHWVKDVIQGEDKARIKKGNGIKTLSILKNIAINICREWGYASIRSAQIYFASNVKKLIKDIRT